MNNLSSGLYFCKIMTTNRVFIHKLISILFILSALISCDNSTNDNYYDIALKKAAEYDKNILLDFSAIWCGGCKGYDIYVFNDSLIKESLNGKYILLKIDTDKQENKFLIDKYKIQGLPHIVIIDSKERILGSISGFNKEYATDPEYFLTDLESILALQDDIRALESEYQSDTTKSNIINKLLKLNEKAGRYVEIKKLKKQLVYIDPTPQRLFEYNFSQAVDSIKNDKNPKALLTFLNENKKLSKEKTGLANSQLLYYYESIGDTIKQDIYYRKLIKIDPDYFTRKYVKFLFEHNLKIDTAIILTNGTLKKNKDLLNDHWGQFIKAHSLVYQGQRDKAVSEYYNWMIDHKSRWESGDTYWPLYFYARFANFHNLDLERALNFIKIAVEKRHMTDDELLMGEILYKLGNLGSSIELLKKVQNKVNNRNEYNRISKLIDKYKNDR